MVDPWVDILREFGLPTMILGLTLIALYRKDKRIDDLVDRHHADAVQNARIMERSAAAIAEAVKRDEELVGTVRNLTGEIQQLRAVQGAKRG